MFKLFQLELNLTDLKKKDKKVVKMSKVLHVTMYWQKPTVVRVRLRVI